MYPGNILTLSDEAILAHYKNSGFKPVSKGTTNAAIREQFVMQRELYAFCKDLTDRGIIPDDGALDALKKSYEEVERYIKKLDTHCYPHTGKGKSSV